MQRSHMAAAGRGVAAAVGGVATVGGGVAADSMHRELTSCRLAFIRLLFVQLSFPATKAAAPQTQRRKRRPIPARVSVFPCGFFSLTLPVIYKWLPH